MASICSNTYTLNVPEGQFFDVSIKHYVLCDSALRAHCKGKVKPVTAFLAHGVGQHKELFEPFLSDLQVIQNQNILSARTVLVDAYAIDCANHGDSAILNEHRLILNNNRLTSAMDYAHSFIALINSGHIDSVDSKCFVFIGFSGGAAAAVLAAKEIMERKRIIPFSSLILLETPLISTPKATYLERNESWMNSIAPAYSKHMNRKQDKWTSSDAAFESLRKRAPYKTWDNRCLKLFIEHGLRRLPTLFYPDDETGVTPKCFKSHEAQAFTINWPSLAMAKALPELCKMLDIHLVFGDLSVLRPSNEEIMLLAAGKDSAYPCDKYASVSIVPGAGHLIVQDAPRETAKCVFDALNRNCNRNGIIGKL